MSFESSTLQRELDRALALDDGDDDALFAGLRRALGRALRSGEAAGWLDHIEGLTERGRAGLALRLVGELLDRLRGSAAAALAERAAAIHLAACRPVRPETTTLAAELFRRECELDAFARADERYAALLGDAGRAEFRRLAEIAWRQVRPSTPDRRAADDGDPARARLAAILDRFATAAGDLDARIAIRARTLTTLANYQAIVALCRRHGRKAEAKRWAEEAEWQFATRRENAPARAAAARGRRRSC
jgi:hypothetical protein